MADITWVDIIIIGIFVVSMLIGVLRGLIREVVAIGIWVAAFWLAATYAEQVSIFLPDAISDADLSAEGPEYASNLRVIAAFVLILVSVLIAGGVVNFILSKLMKAWVIRGIDRLLGLLFGLARACVIMIALVLGASTFTSLPGTAGWQDAQLVRPFEDAAIWVVQRLPERYARSFDFSR